MKKVLVITPRSPFQNRGADEQDRLAGIEWLIGHGYEVRVITKILESDLPHIESARTRLGICITPVSYKSNRRLATLFSRLINPRYWDGAAYEYFDPEMEAAVTNELQEFKPEAVWFDYTYLWPLYPMVRKSGARIITRSINFEPSHFLDEDGRWPWNYLRALPKFASERKAFKESDYFFAITPKEEKTYRSLGSTPIKTLPLRSLPARIDQEKEQQSGSLIRLGFMPSTYKVRHNLRALEFIVEDVLPLVPEAVRSALSIHVTGSKLPDVLKDKLPRQVIYEGFVESSVEFWLSMDIALSPSPFGAGMQQKIFEPLSLGLPTITSKRGIAGYPFACGESVVCAESKEEFAEAITKLVSDAAYRASIGRKAREEAKKLFNKEAIDEAIRWALT